jgi:hypothetical protein
MLQPNRDLVHRGIDGKPAPCVVNRASQIGLHQYEAGMIRVGQGLRSDAQDPSRTRTRLHG